MDLQAQDRSHRIGQTKPVVIYRFITANSVDQKIVERAASKRKLEKMVIHKGNIFYLVPFCHSKSIKRNLLKGYDWIPASFCTLSVFWFH